MTCRIVNHGGGLVSIVCMRGDQTKPCHYCGRRSEKLCDFPLRGPKAAKTCDIPMCANCARAPGQRLVQGSRGAGHEGAG
jgi:hypothetical protein